MKLNEIKKDEQPDGTYAAAKMDKKSCDKIKQFCIENNIPNRVSSEKLHTTIIYSRVKAPELKANQDIYPIKASCASLEIFKTFDEKNALVMKLDCPQLVQHHNNIMEEHGTTYDFPEYVPHITISYDCGDFNPSSFVGELPMVTFIMEYVEDLVLDWQNKNKVSE